MQLDFTEQQRDLRDLARSVLRAECPPALVREVVETGKGAERLWVRLTELGWPALTAPEATGGLGLGCVDLAVVLEELGRAAAPGPYLTTTTQFLPAVRESTKWTAAVAAGEVSGTVALSGDAQAERTAGGWRLHATMHHVLSGTQASHVAVRASNGIAVLPTADLRVEAVQSLDATRPLATIHLDGATVAEEDFLAADEALLDQVRRHAVVGLAIDTVGVCQALMDQTLDYAKVREQFGVPIGSFQALKHRFADMQVQLEKARVLAYFAALTLDENDPRQVVAPAMAKAAAGDCQRLVASSAIQLHGGIGFTWEHDAHLWVKRAKTNELLFGTSREHRQTVASHLFEGQRPRRTHT